MARSIPLGLGDRDEVLPEPKTSKDARVDLPPSLKDTHVPLEAVVRLLRMLPPCVECDKPATYGDTVEGTTVVVCDSHAGEHATPLRWAAVLRAFYIAYPALQAGLIRSFSIKESTKRR